MQPLADDPDPATCPRRWTIYTDVLLHPSFPEKELERLRTQRLSALLRQVDSPPAIAGLVFPKLLYGESHPYGRPNAGTPKSVKGLTRDDVVSFYKTLFVPNNAALIVVGDITPDAIIPVLESALKDWKPGSPVAQTLPEPPVVEAGDGLPDRQAGRGAVDPDASARSASPGARPTTSR